MKRYKNINKELFIQNRERFKKQMKSNSIAIFNSNDEMPRNGDANYDFKQNSDLFYLTGLDQEDCMLVLFPDCPILPTVKLFLSNVATKPSRFGTDINIPLRKRGWYRAYQMFFGLMSLIR